MTIIAAYSYRNGCRLGPVDFDRPPASNPPKDGFDWVGLEEPSEAEMRLCAERFDLHPLAVEDAVKAHQLPKLEVYGDQLFIVALTAMMRHGRIVFGETAFFLAHDHIVTVRHGSNQGHGELRAKLEEAPRLLSHGVDYVLHQLLDLIVDNYFPVIDAVREEMEIIERHALAGALQQREIVRLFTLRRDLLSLQRVLIPMEDVCTKLAQLDLAAIDPEVRPYFRDALDHVRRVASMAALMREVLSSVVETSVLIEQQKQSEITRKLAAWAAILAVPTAIAGIYGMNFQNMPELHWQYGYFVVLGFVAFICLILWLRFRRAGWL